MSANPLFSIIKALSNFQLRDFIFQTKGVLCFFFFLIKSSGPKTLYGVKTFPLHLADPQSFPSISISGPPHTAVADPARRNCWAKSQESILSAAGCGPKVINKQNETYRPERCTDVSEALFWKCFSPAPKTEGKYSKRVPPHSLWWSFTLINRMFPPSKQEVITKLSTKWTCSRKDYGLTNFSWMLINT